MSFSALRAAYSMGGDGESDMRIDVNELAAFVREPAACVTCFLLPTSFHARLEMQVRCSARHSFEGWRQFKHVSALLHLASLR